MNLYYVTTLRGVCYRNGASSRQTLKLAENILVKLTKRIAVL